MQARESVDCLGSIAIIDAGAYYAGTAGKPLKAGNRRRRKLELLGGGTSVMSDSNSKLSVEDRLDIIELFAKYAWGINTGDIEGVLACFAEDGYLDHLWQGKLQGHDKIRRAFEELWYDRPSWWFGRQHLANHFLITREGEGARVKAYFTIVQFNVDYRTNFVFGIGNWDNLCVKRDGRWVFMSMFINGWTDRDKVPWKGDARAYNGPPVTRAHQETVSSKGD
jgi:hypothetical protein